MTVRSSTSRVRTRLQTLRARAWLLVIALTALWAFAAWVTVADGLNLFGVQALNAHVSQPSESLMVGLQAERRLSVVYLADPSQRAALEAARRQTDATATAFRRETQAWQARAASSSETRQRVADVIAGLDQLSGVRASIDKRTISSADAAAALTATIDPIWHVYDSLATLDDQQLARDGNAIIELNRAWELMSQEDALVAGVLASGQLTADQHEQLVQLVALNRFEATEAAGRLPITSRDRYNQAAQGEVLSRFKHLEDALMAAPVGRAALPLDAAEWRSVSSSALTQLHDVILAGGDDVVHAAVPVVIGVVVRLVVATFLGLLTVIAAVRTARTLVGQIHGLRAAALTVATQQLPSVVERLGRGETVDVAAEVPPVATGRGEIGQVARAFAAVQETAIRAAVDQAELRRSVRDVYLSIARRAQALLHRQLATLDAMERQEEDPAKLEDMFKVDHLATRLRRHAENLVVLAGSTAGRQWRRDIPMIDVVRAAAAEVEDYARVTALPIGPVGLAGRAVRDVIHLLAELIENALAFSPPHTRVEVKGQPVANGFVIEIEDRGLGMSEETLAAANAQISSNSEFRPTENARLGLFVVSRLAERHGVRVHLKDSAYGGTTAVVLIPPNLVTEAVATEAAGGGQHRLASRPAGDDLALAPVPAPGGAPAVGAGPEPDEPTPYPRQRTGRAPGTPPAPGEPATPPPGTRTESGLPVRVRQANLPGGRPLATPPAPATPAEEAPRDPEEVLRKMRSYQSGTARGRTDAALAHRPDPDPDSDPAGQPR